MIRYKAGKKGREGHYDMSHSECALFLDGLGAKVDTWPIIGVRQERFIVGLPDSSPHKGVLVHWLRVVERHPFSIEILHHL